MQHTTIDDANIPSSVLAPDISVCRVETARIRTRPKNWKETDKGVDIVTLLLSWIKYLNPTLNLFYQDHFVNLITYCVSSIRQFTTK